MVIKSILCRFKLKKLKRKMLFCKKCGEYVRDNGKCSNPFCPQKIENIDKHN